MQKSICICIFGLIFLCSCSNVPKVANYPVSYQEKMQAVHHWDILAADIAKEIKLSLQANVPPGEEKIYLEPHTKNRQSVFNEIFDTLLKTQLFKQDIKLTVDEESYVKMKYQTQMVKHKSIRKTSPPYPGQTMMLAALGSGIYKAFSRSIGAGLFASAAGVEVLNGFDGPRPWEVPHYEIVITTEVTMNDEIIARRSNIYYINDKDFMHYLETDMPTKSYKVVSDGKEGSFGKSIL